MGKKGKKSKSGGKVIVESSHITVPTNETNNNSNSGVVDEDGLAYIHKDKRTQICKDLSNNESLLLPKKPDLTIDPRSMHQRLLSVPINKRTTTAKRIIKAQEMIDDIERIQTNRGKDYNNEDFVDIDTLKADESYIRECVLWIQAIISSDYRAGSSQPVLFGSPTPSCWAHITSLHPLDDNEPQLMNVDALSFIILLATAMRVDEERLSLQIVHELHAHASYIDFDELHQHEETKELDESYLRFALASVGVKRARALYRDTSKRIITPFQNKNDVAIQPKSLLKSIETFANELCEYRPDSPVGLWNLGWFTRIVNDNGKHPWRAVNEFYNLMADCCLLAEKVDDDFYRAEAGIEVAMSLVLGGKPIVGYRVPCGAMVQTIRDMSYIDEVPEGDIEIALNAPSQAAANEAGDKEQKRLAGRVPPTLLEPGESVLVPHWEVSRIWNFAMEAYLRLDEIGQGRDVYGETYGWHIAEGLLTGKYSSKLVPKNYCICPQIGFTLDKGSPCGYCGKVGSDLKKCSLCKKAQCKYEDICMFVLYMPCNSLYHSHSLPSSPSHILLNNIRKIAAVTVRRRHGKLTNENALPSKHTREERSMYCIISL